MKNNETTNVNVRGVDMVLNVSNRSLELCARMNYEVENLDFIDACQPGDVLYDIGSCEGRFSIYAGLKGLQVHAFEPEQRNYEMLKFNVDNNETTTIVTHNVAVSDKNGEGVLKVGQPWAGGHQKVVDHGESRQDLDFEFKESQTIALCKLDDYIAEHKLNAPQWLKIDVDGSEMAFMQGAHQTLGSPELKGLIFELNKEDDQYQEILDLLKENGWKIQSEHGVPNEPELFNIIFSR